MKIINLAKKYRHLALVLIDVIVVIGSYVTSLLFLNTQITIKKKYNRNMSNNRSKNKSITKYRRNDEKRWSNE